MNNPLHKEVKTTPKDFVFWLGVIVTLYISVISLVVLLFEYIDILFPDPLDFYVDPYSGAIRSAIASLIVIFPLYVYLVRKINVDARKHPAKRELKVRKWLVHLSLFGAALTLVIDLIVLINTFLGGNLATAFLLKVITIFVVIGGVFMYYLYDLKGYWQLNEGKSKIVGGVAAVVILIALVSGFSIMGSPTTQKLLRFDQEKVSDLQNIQWQVLNYYQSKGQLPEELSDLEDSISGFKTPLDPQTNELYTYGRSGELAFTLCAVFNVENLSDSRLPQPVAKFGFENENWNHGEGEFCFKRDIDPDFYPIFDAAPIRVPAFR